MRKTIVATIYTHPELYPPLLNAIGELSNAYSTVAIVSRNLMLNRWIYPASVKYFASGGYTPVRNSEIKSNIWKLFSFLRYIKLLRKVLKTERPQWIMCNDSISLMAFRLIRPTLRFPVKLWYHNHDVAELKTMRKYSVGYFAVKSEQKHFEKVDIFTLPSEARLKYFPINRGINKWLVIPNYPAKSEMNTHAPAGPLTIAEIKIIYQGRISDEHGLEELMNYMRTDLSIRLTIIGPGDENYIKVLKNKSEMLHIQKRLEILDPVPYGELLNITSTHHLGWAVNKPLNIIYTTGAQSSNKIYEYPSVGLPIIYFGNEHYLTHLSKFKWAFPTDLSEESLRDILNKIRPDYQVLSEQAITDFSKDLNYGSVFRPVLNMLAESELSLQ